MPDDESLEVIEFMNEEPDYPIFDRLQKIAERESTCAEEAEDIKYAAFAIHFISLCGHTDEFKKFLEKAEHSLTDDQEAHLKSLGLL